MTVVDGSRTPAWIQARGASRNCLFLQTPRAARTEPTAPREVQSSAVRAYPPRPSPCRNTTVLGSIKWLRTAAGAEEIAGLGAMRHCFQKVTGGINVGLDEGKPLRRSEGSRSGFDIGLGAGAECGSRAGGSGSGGSRAIQGLSRRPSLGCRLPLTRWRYQGLSRAPLRGQDPTPFTGTAPFGPPRLVPATARRWVWPSRSSSTSPGWSMTPAQPKAPSTSLRSRRFPASSTGRAPRSCAGAR
jgi:hypothetical protein